MRSTGDRILEICVAVLLFGICFFAVSAGSEEEGIEISDSLTLYSGDIITLQARDNKYVQWNNGNCGALGFTKYASPDSKGYSEFIVEIVDDNQIRLRTKVNDLYLGYQKAIQSPSPFNTACTHRTYAKIMGTYADIDSNFTVEKMGDNKIALKASNGRYLMSAWVPKYHTCPACIFYVGTPPMFLMITVEADKPYEGAKFTVDRTGLDPGYEQTVSNVKFSIENLTSIITPPIIVRFPPHENTGDGEMHFSIEYASTMKKTTMWTWEKGIELTDGAKITASLKIPGDVATIGSDVSTEIKTTTKNTNSYAEEKSETVTLNEYVQIPPHTKVSAELILTENKVNVPFTALVTVTSNKKNKTYSYPINGTFMSTRFFNIALNVTRKPLNQTLAIKPSMSMPSVMSVAITAENNTTTYVNLMPVATTAENNTTTYMLQSGNSTIAGA